MPNEYVNHVVINGVTKLDLRADTITATSLAQGITAHDRSGAPIVGTGSGGIPSVTQDQDGYLVLDDDQGQNITVEALSVSSSGTYTAPTGKAYSPVTVPAGSVSASATKGTVSNHQVSVTPKATVGTAGFLSTGDTTGTAVTVAASELVSGTYNVTSSGTKDVTNYASASIAASERTASATKGTVSNHSVTVTPTATTTAGFVNAGSTNGTAVTVSASELVSGTKSITANGTNIDVTDYASVDVSVSGGGGSNGYTLTTVLPQQTITAGSDRQAIPTDFTGLVAGEDYLITYDGVEYVSTCGVAWTNNNIVGDIQVVWATSDITYPFAVIYVSQSDKAVFCSTTGNHTIKIEHMELIDPLVLTTKSITANGTYNASSDNADGFSSVTVNVSGGGDSWSWMGKNPTKIKTYAKEKVYFKDTSFPNWTWSTSSTSIVAAAEYAETITCDLTTYDYITVMKLHVHYDYGSWTPTAAVTDYSFAWATVTYGYCTTLAGKQSGTPGSATSATLSSRYQGYYVSSGGTSSYGSLNAGLYTYSVQTPVYKNGSYDARVYALKKPALMAQGSASYYSQDAFTNTNMNNSYYEFVAEVWRVDRGTSVTTEVIATANDILDNGL